MATSHQSNNIPTVQSNNTDKQQYNQLLSDADKALSHYIEREKSDENDPFIAQGKERTDRNPKKESGENATKILEKIYNSELSKPNNFNGVCAELIMYIKLQEYKRPQAKSMAAGAGITAGQTVFGTLGKLLAGIFRPIIKMFAKETSIKDNTIQGKPITNKDAAIAALSDLLPLLKIMRDAKGDREGFIKDPTILLHLLHPGAVHVIGGSAIAAVASKSVDSIITPKAQKKASLLIDYVLEGKDNQNFNDFEKQHQNSNTNPLLESLINRQDVGNEFKKAVNARLKEKFGNSNFLKFKEPTAEEYKKNISTYINIIKRKAKTANLPPVTLVAPVTEVKANINPPQKEFKLRSSELEDQSKKIKDCKGRAADIEREMANKQEVRITNENNSGGLTR